MRVLVLFDLGEKPPAEQDAEAYRDDFRDESWRTEADVVRALGRLGHDVGLFGLYDDAAAVVGELERFRPDVVFNLCEAFAGDRGREAAVKALLELRGAKATGAAARSLLLCKDKALAKALVGASGVCVPRSIVVPRASRRARAEAARAWGVFPAIVKPLGLESSMGIALGSLVRDARELELRITLVHESLAQAALVEEYVDGREIYVATMAGLGEPLVVLPARELDFGRRAGSGPRIATYRAKWDEVYRQRRGIRNRPARALKSTTAAELERVARAAARALGLDAGGYARFDLRLADDGNIWFLEANPNPSLARLDDFALSAAASGISYDELIADLLATAASEMRARPRRDRGPTSRAARAGCSPPAS